MTNILCKLTDSEQVSFKCEHIDLNVNNNSIYTYTFWNQDKKLYSPWSNIDYLPNFFTDIGIDLLYISLFVYGADRLVLRENTKDSWTRDFNLLIPVLELDKWEANKVMLEELLNFLSGDKWTIEFRKRELLEYEEQFKEKIDQRKSQVKDYKEVCMFSGGLDSFIGLVDLLKVDDKNRIFVSHYGGGKGTKEFQDTLRECIKEKYGSNDTNFYNFYAAAHNGIEDTTRTRSLMFFAHAIALCTCMSNPVSLIIPENGLISLNIPLTSSRLGSSSTRTTHPYYMRMLQDLLIKLGADITIINPYQFMTKGEMLIQSKDKSFLEENIVNTMSCSHPDIGRLMKEKEARHCGYCLPCAIRRASIKKAGLEDLTNYRDAGFSGGDTAKISLNSYKLGVAKFNEKSAFLTIQKAGPIVENIDLYTSLYKRGITELKDLLEEY